VSKQLQRIEYLIGQFRKVPYDRFRGCTIWLKSDEIGDVIGMLEDLEKLEQLRPLLNKLVSTQTGNRATVSLETEDEMTHLLEFLGERGTSK